MITEQEAKRKEIREKIEEHINEVVGPSWAGYETDELLKLLSSLGIVIAVKGELPKFGDRHYYFLTPTKHEREGYVKAQQDMLNDGYKLTVPLVEK